jgi:hypothetical protein
MFPMLEIQREGSHRLSILHTLQDTVNGIRTNGGKDVLQTTLLTITSVFGSTGVLERLEEITAV